MYISREELLRALIESNSKRMRILLERNSVDSADHRNQLPADELVEWERLNKINDTLKRALAEEICSRFSSGNISVASN